MNGMSISISIQLFRFLWSCCFGIVLSFFYDFLRIIRNGFGRGRLVTVLTDSVFSFSAVASFSLYVLIPCEGDIRAFLIFGLAGGMILYFLTISRWVLRLGDHVFALLKKIISIILFPFRLLHKKFLLHRQKRRKMYDNCKQEKESG